MLVYLQRLGVGLALAHVQVSQLQDPEGAIRAEAKRGGGERNRYGQ